MYLDLNKRNYDTDFSILDTGKAFPSAEVKRRNRQYRHNLRLFTGEYANNKNLVAMVNGAYQDIDYKTLPLNYFELIVNKMYSLMLGNDLEITTGNIERDKIVKRLVEKTRWKESVGEAIKYVEIFGDCPIKTWRNGISVFSPTLCYKVLDITNKKNVLGYVMHELLYEKQDNNILGGSQYKVTHIRFLVSCKGFEYERVFEFSGNSTSGTIGKPVRYKYKDRWIPRKGRYYKTGIENATTVQWLSVNTEKDGVYGCSAFDNIKDLVFALENRLSTENWIIDSHGKPLLCVSMTNLKTDEATGEYRLSIIDDKYMVSKATTGGTDKPEYLEWNGKLTESKQVRDDIMEHFYDLTEMGKTFLSGQYQGQVTEESLNNMIKSALDRGQRDADNIVYSLMNSLYVLCKLNDIDVELGDINITFNIGRIDDTKSITDICEKLDNIKLFSKETLLSKFWGYNTEDAKAELERVRLEGVDTNFESERFGLENIGGETNDIT